MIAMRVAAEIAQLAVADVVADGAGSQVVLDVHQGLGQPLRVFAWSAQNMERQTLRRFLADSGQTFEFLNQARERFSEVRHEFDSRAATAGREANPFRLAGRPFSPAWLRRLSWRPR